MPANFPEPVSIQLWLPEGFHGMLVDLIAQESDAIHQGALSRCLEGLRVQIRTSQPCCSREVLSEQTLSLMHFFNIGYNSVTAWIRLAGNVFAVCFSLPPDFLMMEYGLKMLECFYLCLHIVVPVTSSVIQERTAYTILVLHVQNQVLSRETIWSGLID